VKLVINEVTVIGSRCGVFAPALEALEEKTVSVTPLIEKVIRWPKESRRWRMRRKPVRERSFWDR